MPLDLEKNIGLTVCANHEIIHIDNSKGEYNIFEAYNLGIKRAKGEYLCFMHEDIIFKKQGWGKVVEQFLSRDEVGALGVAGGHVVVGQIDWRFYGFLHLFLTQGYTSIEPLPVYYYPHTYVPSTSGVLKQVAVIDGVWMCFRKTMFNHICFDEQNFRGFHLYDSDICMQVNKLGKGVFVTDEVFLEHKSEGTFSEGYRNSLKLFFKKWETSLPLIKGITLRKEDVDKVLPEAYQRFEERLKRDSVAVEIRKLIRQKEAGIPTRIFTPEEEAFMDQSSFFARKCLIKDKSVSTALAWNHTKEYLRYPFVRHKCKLLFKFLWYRYIKIQSNK